MSNRLTFSLASFILIFVAGFALLTPGIVNAADPTFGTATQADLTLTVDAVMTPVLLPAATDADGDAITYSLSPSAPSGLSFNAVGRSLTGTPSVVAAATEFTYTATADGDTDTLKFKITIKSDVTFPDGSEIKDQRYKQNRAITPVNLPIATDASGRTIDYRISPDLPDGLTFANNSIYGRPTAVYAQVEHTYTATDSGNSTAIASLKFKLSVVAPTSPTFSGSVSNVVATVGKALTATRLPMATDTDGDELTYTLTPNLPSGLETVDLFNDGMVFVLQGTPNAEMAKAKYTWTVTDEDGNTAKAEFDLTVNATTPPPTGTPAAPTALTATADQTAKTVALSWTAPTENGGSDITGYTIEQTGAAAATYEDIAATATSFTTPALTKAGTYSFTVAAKNANGTGAATAAVEAKIDSDATDTTKPTLVITHSPADKMPLNAKKELTFTFTFSEALAATGAGMFTVDDVLITNATKGTLSDPTDGTAGEKIYELPVTVYNVARDVKVTVAASSVKDVAGNNLAADVSETYIRVNAAPVLGAPAGIKAIVGRELLAKDEEDRATVGTRITGLLLPRAIDDDHDIITYELSPDLSEVDLNFIPNRQGDQTLHGDRLGNLDPSPDDLFPSVVYAPTGTYEGDVEYIARDGHESTRSGLKSSQKAKFKVEIKEPIQPGKVKIISAIPDYDDDTVKLTWHHLPLRDAYNDAHDTASEDSAHKDGETGVKADRSDDIWKSDPNMDNTQLRDLQVWDPDLNTLVDLKADDHDKGYIIDWDYKEDESNDGGAEVYQYQIIAKGPNGDLAHRKTIDATGTEDGTQSYTIKNLGGPYGNRDLGIYEFTVTAINKLLIPDENRYRAGPYGERLEGVESDVAYAKVADIPDRTGVPVATSNVSAGTITVTWTVPAGSRILGEDVSKTQDISTFNDPHPHEDTWSNGAPITAYLITQVKIDPATGAPIKSQEYELAVGDIRNPRNPEYTVPEDELEVGTYQFRVAAFSDAGRAFGSVSDRVVKTAEPVAPPNVAPTFGNATIAAIMATEDMAITGVTLPAATDSDGDDSAIRYRLSPTLPTGLTFNATTRFLSGTPTVGKARTTYTYTATDSGGKTAALSFEIEVKATPTPTPTGDLSATYVNGVTTITSGMIAANGFATVGAPSLPDLEEFLSLGGTIGLSDGDATADGNSRTVVISEILWGLDLGAPAMEQDQWQFIELYNTTGAPINLAGWTLTFTAGRPVPASDIDQVSNRSGAGWNLDKGNSHGQSGRVTGTMASDLTSAVTPVNIISMYRNINYAHVEKNVANRGELVKGIPGGNGSGSWKASQRRSAYNRWIYDSKRAEHWKSTDILTPSSVARTPFIINEVGNGTGDTHDWVEIRNVTTSEHSLKNYHLSYVPGHNTDTSLVNFHDKDIKVPGGGILLLVNTDPRNTDIAAGQNVSVAAADQDLTGVQTRYYVNSNLKLPDNGKFNLILRNAHDKLKASSHFMDVIGGQVVPDTTKGTSLWPLVAAGGPHGNVIEGHGRDLKAPYAYIRKNAGGGTGEKHLGRVGYTGVGYDRVATKSDANGGTPGYDNGALKEKIADLSNADVTISEIMLEVGAERQNLPQWIELHNSSLTQGVNTNGWKLHIENYDDVDTALSATITLGAMTIAPNQTILIVTNTTGRISDADHFPSHRVVNLWTTKAHRDALGTAKRTDQVFSSKGFYIELTDKDNKMVDAVGNLDGSRRTRDEPTWDIPMSAEGDEHRSSLIRRYTRGSADDGTTAEGWALARNTSFSYTYSGTYYGDADDYGTPGFRAGGPLPVSLSKFRPERLDDGTIVVRWITESELNNAGFNILRSETKAGEYTKLNTQLIKGQGTTSERTAYEFIDKSAKPNVIYYYQIQDVSLDGKVTPLRVNRLKGYVNAAGKATTTWGELKALQ